MILSPSGEVITTKGRRDVQDRGVLAYTYWVTSSKRNAAGALEARRRVLREAEEDRDKEGRDTPW